MCPTCEPFSEKFKLIRSFDYRSLLRQAKALVDAGTLQVLPGSASFEGGPSGRPAGEVHRTSCAACRQHFRLVRETYGSAGMWELTSDATA